MQVSFVAITKHVSLPFSKDYTKILSTQAESLLQSELNEKLIFFQQKFALTSKACSRRKKKLPLKMLSSYEYSSFIKSVVHEEDYEKTNFQRIYVWLNELWNGKVLIETWNSSRLKMNLDIYQFGSYQVDSKLIDFFTIKNIYFFRTVTTTLETLKNI